MSAMTGKRSAGAITLLLVLPLLGLVAGVPNVPRRVAQTQPDNKPGDIAARVHYGETVIVVSVEEGVAAFDFPSDVRDPRRVDYRFRYWRRSGNGVESGGGVVFERARIGEVPAPPISAAAAASAPDRPVPQGELLQAGPISLRWSPCDKWSGWMYYKPERACVYIAGHRHFATLDLKRFGNGWRMPTKSAP